MSNNASLPNSPGVAIAVFSAVCIYTAGFAPVTAGTRDAIFSFAIGGLFLFGIIEYWNRGSDESN